MQQVPNTSTFSGNNYNTAFDDDYAKNAKSQVYQIYSGQGSISIEDVFQGAKVL